MLPEGRFGQPNQLDSALQGDVPCSSLEPAPLEGGCLMIKTVEIENYRCFERATLNDLKLLNVVVGSNASGKTALLESLFLGAGANPEIILRMRSWRGLGEPKIRIERKEFGALWRDIFYEQDDQRTISVSLNGTSHLTTGRVRINFAQSEPILIPISTTEDSPAIVPLRFQGVDCSGKDFDYEVGLTPDGQLTMTKPQVMSASFFPSAFKANPEESARRFSGLSKKKKQSRIIESLQQIYPFIKDLSLEINAGVSMIYADVDGMPEKMPVQIISEGVYKLMNIFLAMIDHPGGFVIVDEIENGFYYETLPEIWKLLLHFARSFRTQIFVSSHSLECLRAASEAAKGNEGEFGLLRTVKENGRCYIKQFTGQRFVNAIEEDFELR
jgi:AAA15 family ATPase/GTPase